MYVHVRDIEAVGERDCESCGCGGVAGWGMVGGYVALVGGAVAWESAAVEEAECRVRWRYLHRNGASGKTVMPCQRPDESPGARGASKLVYGSGIGQDVGAGLGGLAYRSEDATEDKAEAEDVRIVVRVVL